MAHAILLLRSLLFEAWFYLSMAVMGLVFLPAAIVSGAAARYGMRLFCRQAFAALRMICGLRCEIRGAIPDRPVIIAAKHQSFLDVLMLMRWAPHPVFVMKKSLVWAPILGLYALRIGAIPIDRSKGARALVAMEAAAAQASGQIVVYPQGTRVPATREPGADPEPYRRGAARLALQLERPLLPVATNAGLFWRRASLVRRPGLAVIEILPEIAPEGRASALTQRLEAAIEPATDRLVAEGRS
jgi:1-acyl-sn-glycerol-3-phosphate acyltransferase